MVAKSKIYHFDKAKAERPIKFIENYLVLPTGAMAGRPFKVLPYFKYIIRQANGWVYKSNGTLKHRSVYVEIPKGNAKTPTVAAIAIYKACAADPQLKNGEIYVLAGDREQAKILLQDCKHMIEGSPRLVDKFDIQKDIIYHKKTRTFIKALSSDAYSKHGPRPDVVIFDELHVQKNRELYDTMVKALFKKQNSQLYMITTAGVVDTFAETIHNYAQSIEKGIIKNDAWFVKIYAADIEDDPFAEKTWKKANPGYGTVINPFDFKAFVQTAKDMPSELNSFLRLHLNIWTGSEKAWIPSHEWDQCDLYPVTLADLEGREVWAGLDLASTRDTIALVLISPRYDTGIIDVVPFFWVPETTIRKRETTEHIDYSAWVRADLMKTTPGNAVDYEYMEQDIIEINKKCRLVSIAYDRKFAAAIIPRLNAAGIDCEPFGQGYLSMSFPTKELEKMIVNKQVNHAGNPVLRWQVNNAVTDHDPADNIKLNKAKSKDKIDGVVALIMAIGQYFKDKDAARITDDYDFTII